MRPEPGRGNSPSAASSSGGLYDGARGHRHGRETVEFSVKGPVGVNINDEQLTNSGCAVLDLLFAAPSQVGELTFRNYYTMWLTVLIKTKLSPTDPASGTNIGSLPTNTPHKEDAISDWTMSVPRKVLMQYPHQETGSHDMVSISCAESTVEWRNLVAMRVVLRQPSPVWRTFHIEEINVYKDLPRRAPNKESASDSLMLLIKRQTIAALKWVPNTENNSHGYTGAYEFNSLPQP